MTTYLYPEDRTGAAASNKVTAELHSVTFSADADFHFIVPTHAPFFATGFRMVRVVAGNRILLNEGLDYHFGLRFMSASVSLAKPLYGAVVLLNMSEDSVYEIEQYQTLGGQWTLDSNAMVEMAANIIKNPRSLSWEQVTGIPQVFNPTDHPWAFADMVGQSELVAAVMAVANAIASQATTGNNHHLLKGNVHDLSKYDLDLGQVPNYPVADLTEAMNEEQHTTLLTPMLMHAVLEAMGLHNLSDLAASMRNHLNNKLNPHLVTKDQVQLGEVVNLPLATHQDIVRNLNVDKYITLSSLKQWMQLHGGSLQEKTAAPIPQGALLQSYCTAEKDRMGVYADGKGGTYESIVKLRDVDCGYASTVPVAHPEKGTVLSTYCSGTNLMHLVANGSGGVTSTVGEVNSSSCTSGNYPPNGTVLSTTCEGTTLVRTLANGSGGTTIERTENSSQCQVNNHPARGTLLSFQCVGFNVVGTYADGTGGTYEGVIERNSTDCGYVAPTVPPTSTFPPAGTVLGTTCAGYNLQEIRANGSGGQYTVTTVPNSTECGYYPTSTPSPTGTPTPTGSPDKVGTVYYSTTLSNIWRGDTEAHTITMSGWTPNKRYKIDIMVRSTAWGQPYERDLGEEYITTDNNGNGAVVFMRTDTGIVPVGVYECWMTEAVSGRVSNTVIRTFHGDRP